ncbi:mitochondrial import receptor subunit TOM40 [Pseudoscourfieldia marina]
MGVSPSHMSTVGSPVGFLSCEEAEAEAGATIATPAVPTTAIVDYMELPRPVKYEELQKEAMMSLKPECFEGFRFDFMKHLNQKFSLSHSVYMGSVDVPSQSGQTVKVPVGTYEFGANLITQGDKGEQRWLIGRMLSDGRMSGRCRYDVSDALSFKLQAQLAQEAMYSQIMADVDLQGTDWNAQVKLGNNEFYGVNYLQSVTPTLAMGGEAFWLGSQRKSGVGFAARHSESAGHVATCQVATTGLLSLTYVHKASEKAALASDFMWNWNAREATATFGYDYMLRQCRLRGRVDTNGVVACFLEEKLNVGVTFLLSAELDHSSKNYKFGFGMSIGE